MPQLGETVTEGTVAQWLKRPGDAIEKYEAFVEVSTDKVNAEVPSPVTGVLREIICQEGETVPTGAPIAIIDELGAETIAAPGPEAPAAAPLVTPSSYGAPGAGPGVPAVPVANGASSNGSLATSNGAASNGSSSEAILRGVSPAVRKLAREHHIDVAQVHGTGHNGRVTANDVIAAASQGPAAAAAAAILIEPVREPVVSRPSAGGTSSYAAPVPGTLVPLSPARKIIAKRMVESLATAPHAWTMVEVDVTNLWKWRAKEKDRFLLDKGYALTLLPFFIHATVQSLRKHPLLNSRFTDDGIVVNREINIGIAIGLDSNLMVPVIREADTLSIAGLAIAAGKIIDRARAGKLSADELGGGTFTVNNTGANGSVLSKPIINGGQAAIVTMEAVIKRAVVIEDAIAIRSMMNVCLSLDHRVLDGTSANAFLGDLKKRLEGMGPSGDL
ncbi:MAG: 2-oxo acid dehydrogenase subunit E2 [Candidatus Eremiobacteraeota bacterium]|nr:2-oxo acid dehydrogenase subunit E2 [Candidatus Eremiobacteraeota bacterium]